MCDPAELRTLIDECRRSGYAAVADELAYGVVALAVPVLDQSGRVVAALNSSSHSGKTTQGQTGPRPARHAAAIEQKNLGGPAGDSRPLPERPGLI